MIEPTLVLVHSPFLGPGSWQPVAEVLRARGRQVVVPSLVDALSTPAPLHPALASAVVATLDPSTESVVLVAHSGAGPLVPSIAVDAPYPTRAAILVDAPLPHPGRSQLDTVSPGAADRAHRMAGPNGLLAPWPEWFPETVIDSLLPDPQVRERLRAESPQVPLRYLTERAPEHDGWERLPYGYVQLSTDYAHAAREASRRGWAVTTLDSHHLGLLADPVVVADAIVGVLERL